MRSESWSVSKFIAKSWTGVIRGPLYPQSLYPQPSHSCFHGARLLQDDSTAEVLPPRPAGGRHLCLDHPREVATRVAHSNTHWSNPWRKIELNETRQQSGGSKGDGRGPAPISGNPASGAFSVTAAVSRPLTAANEVASPAGGKPSACQDACLLSLELSLGQYT